MVARQIKVFRNSFFAVLCKELMHSELFERGVVRVKSKARYKVFKSKIRYKIFKVQDRRALVKTMFIAVLVVEGDNMFPPIDSRVMDMKPINPKDDGMSL